ncbi:MAG: type VI secretion system Vgr family protein [Flavobacteriales bacterium]
MFRDSQPTSKIYNAKEIAENQIMGINRVVELTLVVKGKIIKHFDHFLLKQSAKKHHFFEVSLPHDILDNFENHELNEAQDFLGKRLTAIFKYKGVEDSPERVFVGVVLEVGYKQEQGSLGNIVLKGKSPTILLDMAPHTQSFGGVQTTNLNIIADSVIKEGLGSSQYDIRVDSEYQKEIAYSSQYNETHFNYLARTAEAYGEQFFYDGEVLHFGKLPPQEKPVELVYGSNVSEIGMKMKAVHVNPTFYGYNSSRNEKLTSGESAIKHRSDIAERAYNISKKTVSIASKRVAPIKAFTDLDVVSSQKGTAGSKAVEVFTTSGNVSIPFLYPGCIANINMRKRDSSKTNYFTKLMITETVHEVDGRGHYKGSFEAIAADTGFLPRPEFEQPLAETQIATVISNTDPENKGRVQVRFDWQLHDTTEFIRVMSPDAGSSDKVSKNRGFMSIPEVGDQVMVNFQHNHPDRPFVMGGMFHGISGGGGGTGNNVMSFSGRSGAELKYDNGAGSMNLKDQGGANMFFDGAGNATMNTNTDNTINAGQNNITNTGSINVINVGGSDTPQSILKMDSSGNVIIDAKTSITLKVGDNLLSIDNDGLIKLNGKNIKQQVENNYDLNAKRVTQTAKGANFKINSDQKVIVSGGREVKMK